MPKRSCPLQKRENPIEDGTDKGCNRDFGPDHVDTLSSIASVAATLALMGDYEHAEPLMRRALEVRERDLGYDHPTTLTTLSNLAMLLCDIGDYTQAEPLLRSFGTFVRNAGARFAATRRSRQ